MHLYACVLCIVRWNLVLGWDLYSLTTQSSEDSETLSNMLDCCLFSSFARLMPLVKLTFTLCSSSYTATPHCLLHRNPHPSPGSSSPSWTILALATPPHPPPLSPCPRQREEQVEERGTWLPHRPPPQGEYPTIMLLLTRQLHLLRYALILQVWKFVLALKFKESPF